MSFSLSAQKFTVSGKVIDGETGEAIPFGNVYPKNNPQGGTTTDFDGYYTLQNVVAGDSIIVSYIGYFKKSKAVKAAEAVNGVITLNFQLFGESKKLEEIVVVAGEDPAYPIMREVIRNKKRNDVRQLEAYEYESYVKIELDVDNISERFGQRKIIQKVQQAIDSVGGLTGEDGRPLIPLFLAETISRFYYRNNPERKSEQVIKTKIDGVGLGDDSPINQILGSTFQQYNFYNDWMKILEKDFVSPLSNSWKFYYDYYLADSLMLGEHACYKIEIYPKRPQDLAFEGVIWITKEGFALKQIDVKIGRTANINFIEKIKIQQELEPTEAGPWIPSKSRILIDVSEITEKSAGLLAKFYVSNRDAVINKPYPISFYREAVTVAPDATLASKDFWALRRHDSLTLAELKTYALIDTIKQVPIVKTYSGIVRILTNNYITVGPIDFGNIYQTYAFNNIENQYFRLGIRTNTQFSNKVEFKGFLGYGTRDARFKYGARLRYIPSRKRWTEIVAERSDDLVQMAANPDGLRVFEAFQASLRFFNVDDRSPFYRQESNFYVQTDLFKGFTQTVQFRNLHFQPIGNHFAYIRNPGQPESQILRNFATSEIVFETRLSKGEQFFYNGNYRNSLGTRKLPIVTLRYSLGLQDLLGSDFEYHKFGISLEQRLRMGLLGSAYYFLSATYTPSVLPYPLLEIHPGNRGYFYNFYGFNLMNFLEFVSDQQVSLNFEHNFEGLIANRIPLLRKWKWRTFVATNMVYGGLNVRNQEIIPVLDAEGFAVTRPQGFGEIPYIELGYGITNIFRFFRVTFMHRLTYRDTPDTRKFGVFFSARLQL
ncbi:MAG: DUF5686 and carboxypeptidase-like regulatory domain-containing protein [Microscillaceae bacterium]